MSERGTIFIQDSCIFCTYKIVITVTGHTLYTVTASTDQVTPLISTGSVITASADAGQYIYYRFVLPAGFDGTSVTISVAALSGDPDIFVRAMDVSNPGRPTRTDLLCLPECTIDQDCPPWCVWYSMAFGSDSMTLHKLAGDTTYYIGIYAFLATQFTISVSYLDIGVTDGYVAYGSLSSDSHQFYTFFMGTDSHNINFALKMFNGQADMYISNDREINAPNIENLNFESNLRSTAKIDDILSQGVIRIQPGGDGFCLNCTFFVLINNTGILDAAYDLCVSTQSCFLTEGNPSDGFVEQGGFVYFRFWVAQNSTSSFLQITVSPVTGDVRLYMSHSESNQNPTEVNAQFKSSKVKACQEPCGDQLLIYPKDESENPWAGLYYIGVFGVTASTFSVVASTATIHLIEGPIQIGFEAEISYFWFQTAQTTDNENLQKEGEQRDVVLRIMGAPTETFDVVMARFNPIDSQSENNHTQPTRETPGVQTFVVSFSNPFVLSANSDFYCAGCYYYIGVYGNPERYGRSFQILIEVEFAFGTLVFDNPVITHGKVGRLQYKYYELILDDVPLAGMNILVETCVGNANLFVSKSDARPSTSNFDYVSESNDDVDLVRFKTEQVVRIIRIAVFGEVDSSYQISSFTPNNFAPDVKGVEDLTIVPVEKDTVEVSFSAASSIYGSENLKYTLYFSKHDSNVVMYSVCGMEFAGTPRSVDPNKRNSYGMIVVRVDELEIGADYVFNVIVKDSANRKTAYRANNVLMSTESSNFKLILGIGLPVLIFAALSIAFLAYRNRKLTKELEIEMEDVPKESVRKAIRGPMGAGNQTKQTKTYTRLLVEEDDYDEVVDATDDFPSFSEHGSSDYISKTSYGPPKETSILAESSI